MNAEAIVPYFEWMTYCEAWTKNYAVRTRYFVSRGYNPNPVFIYYVVDSETNGKLEGGEAYLEALFTNISINVS